MLPRCLLIILITAMCNADYYTNREFLRDFERGCALGSNITLTDDEEKVNKILLKHKHGELEEGMNDSTKFLASQHFMKAKSKIEESEVFKFIRRMPKGASLHSHMAAMPSQEYVHSLTYTNGLYICVSDDEMYLHFNPKWDCSWKKVAWLRCQEPNFDAWLKTKLRLDYESTKDYTSAWKKFQQIFNSIDGMFSYMPIFKDYIRQALQEFYDDNILYVEFRDTLSAIYDLDKFYTPIEIVAAYVEVLDVFKEEHPDFLNARLIYAPFRKVMDKTMVEYMNIAQKLKARFPDFIAGFDLVGHEEMGRPLIDFVEIIQSMHMAFFFHAGETNWNGATDLNLLDAVLLGSSRIGHGYAITKHPAVLKLVKEIPIAIELCPISNQVLKLVSDLRNHPGCYLFAKNYPVVICSDDPGFWGAKGLSYDFYYAFMAFTSYDVGLEALKQLALNSLVYSTMCGEEKEQAMIMFEYKWNEFINSELKNRVFCDS